MESMGGGIYVYEALSAASQILLKAKSGTKHIILFSDAADSEVPGNYQDLMAQCNKAGITVSVIGLGTERDVDGELLKDIAKRGKGRIFFTDRPEELPRLFAQDTFVVARNTFIDEPVGVRTTAGLTTLMDQPLQSPAGLKIGGYNLCYLRPEATLATVTLDEYKAPVAAAWKRAPAGWSATPARRTASTPAESRSGARSATTSPAWPGGRPAQPIRCATTCC